MPIINIGMSTTTTQPTSSSTQDAQLGIELAAVQSYIATAYNTAARANYQQALAAYVKAYGVSPNTSAPPPPPPPMIMLVDAASIEALEAQADALLTAGKDPSTLNWGSAITWIQDPPTPIIAPENVIVIADAAPLAGYPGYYGTASGDASQVPAGFEMSQNGKKYVAVKVGFMGATWWQLQP